ncbi:Multi-domain cystatin [Fasciola hepatica]|uniref:Multi-domain cystatin n=1 Tax=Fasciola hepatica TaxID=6192 RepID=A0A4E0RCV5_FASHE|nr:Multi-domain cystatin [Fasciola hepatica]
MNYLLIILSSILLSVNLTEQNLLGGKRRLTRDEIHSDEFGQILSSAVLDCNRDHLSEYWHRQETVSDATKQIVQGVNYEFNVRLRQTECLKQRILDGQLKETDEECKVRHNTPIIVCSAAVWSRPWLKEKIQVNVRGHWKITPEKFSISEIQSALLDQTELAQQFTMAVSTAVKEYNRQGSHQKLVKYAGIFGKFRQTEEPGILENRVFLQSTNCARPTTVDQFEQLKTDDCHTTDESEKYLCVLKITETMDNATIVNCESLASAFGGMWRLVGPGLKVPGKPKGTTEASIVESKAPTDLWRKHWSSEPVDIVLLSNVRDVPPEQLESEEIKSVLREVVFAFNARINDMFMYTLSSVKSIKLQTEPEKKYTFTVRMQLTDCKKNQYIERMDAFEKDCSQLDSSKPVEECQMTASYTCDSKRPYRIGLNKCTRLSNILLGSPGSRVPLDAKAQAEGGFKNLLEKVADKFNAQSKLDNVYEVDKAENVMSQVVSGQIYTMNVVLKPTGCKLSTTSSCSEPTYQCDVEIFQGHSGNPVESINVTNCWRLVENSNPVNSKWIKLDIPSIDKEDIAKVTKRAVEFYNQEHNKNSPDWTYDYVDDVRKLTGTKELLSLFLFMKKDPDLKMKCYVTALTPYDDKNKITFTKCHKYRLPDGMPGGARSLSKDELDEEDFKNILMQAEKLYNEKTENRYFHRLDRITNPTIQVVAGSLTKFQMHMQPTSCLKSKHKDEFEKQRYGLCGSVNVTHVAVCDVDVWRQPWRNFEQIKLGSCEYNRRNITSLGVIQPNRKNILAQPHFVDMLDRATTVVNTQMNNKVFYKRATVENVQRQLVNGYKYTFEMGLHSTKCLRDEDFKTFTEKHWKKCTGKEKIHALHCRVSVWQKAAPEGEEEVTLESCIYAYPPAEQADIKQKRLRKDDLEKPEFRLLEKHAASMFNDSVESLTTYNVYSVENVKAHSGLGQNVEFDMYLKPGTSKLSAANEDHKASLNETSSNLTIPLFRICPKTRSQFFIQCHVEAWKRPWLQNSSLVRVDKCRIIHEGRNNLMLGSLGAPDRNGVNKTYLDEVIPRLVEMFNRRSDLLYSYEKENVENAEQRIVAGQLITFDLFMKPIQGSSKCSGSTDAELKCPPENHFYFCKASVWSREWLKSEVLDLKDCAMVERPKHSLTGAPQPIEVQKPNPKLTDIKERAITLYNEKLSDDFVYGNGKISDAEEQVVAGLITRFKLRMEPVACKRTARNRQCNPLNSRLRVECQVVFWERPWMDESEKIALDNCRRFFNDGTAANHEVRLSREEEQSADFQLMLDQMAKLYQPNVPIVYDAKKILNARVKHNKVRNITFNIILKPSGCNESLPGSEEAECKAWAEQDEVSCEGQISEHPTGYRTMSLRNCRVLWKTESERALTKTEQASKWFLQSVRDAMKLFQSSSQANHQFRLRSVESGTLRRSDVELVKYKMILAETLCAPGEGDVSNDEQCPEKEPPVLRTCQVELKRKPDHSHDLSISC